MADLLKFYRIHISQPSPLGLVRARHFEYCFRSQNIEPLVEDFRRFSHMHVQLGFYSFRWRDNVPKIMSAPPKGFTAWKSKFFYVKKVVVACKLFFRNVTEHIPKEKISVPAVGKQDWAATLQAVPLVTLGNKELQYLRMIPWNKPGVKKKLVVKEQDKGDFVVVQFWRTFAVDFEGKIEVVECGEGEEGWYEASVVGFQLPNPTALDAPLPQGRGNVSMFGISFSLQPDIFRNNRVCRR
ncbi:hypothetical protein HanPI659440_Chr11g0411161 [Helianthus annuus]|nr:hypothetical protein HanPI659440_Chr11g0411161 [Helianthus annuus]